MVLDTARADAFEPYGAPLGSTPAFRGLADAGHAAPAMHAASSWTLPSHAAMFSGLTPRRAGLVRAPKRTPPSCKPVMEHLRPRLLPEVLRSAGYETRGVSANLWISATSGFDTGFDEFVSIRNHRNTAMIEPGPRSALRWAWHSLRCLEDDGATLADATIARFLAQSSRQPLFWGS
ncbi:MAG: sulfatase-like hydrolase/transferase [Actinobacteria bacterium]|nr:sulfatase-like hydrolase/transferase [Actinomycetota bacterium]